MANEGILVIKSLKELVYEYLRDQMRSGDLLPGAMIDMNETAERLGVSKTPLRDALIQLDMEGFVSILPRRGIVVNPLTLKDIRQYYEIIGALESTALLLGYPFLDDSEIRSMEKHTNEMEKAIEAGGFDLYYEKNLKFHDAYLRASANDRLVKTVHTLKKRLYDFPRQKGFIKEWETASILEHREILRLIKGRQARPAADYVRDVHWSFDVQRIYIDMYYPQVPLVHHRRRRK